MADPTVAAGGTGVLVEHFYRELAEERAARARRLLSADPPERSLSQSAEAFVHAVAALQQAITLAPGDGELAEQLHDQAEALLLMAARFEQSAELARHAANGRPPRA